MICNKFYSTTGHNGKFLRKAATGVASLALIMALLAPATPIQAENRAGTLSLSPFAGGYTVACFEEVETSWYLGLRAGYNLSENLGLEGFLGYSPVDRNAFAHDQGRDDAHVYRYGGEVLYHFMPRTNFVPFLAIGYGGMKINDAPGVSDRHRGVFDYGAGLKYFIAKDVALRADVRHCLMGEWGDTCTNFEFTGGMTFQFGG